MRVRFLAHYRIWNAGEIAAFPDDVGEALAARGIAARLAEPFRHADAGTATEAVVEPPAPAQAPDMPRRRVRRAAVEQDQQ
jgi:hypothetical protein